MVTDADLCRLRRLWRISMLFRSETDMNVQVQNRLGAGRFAGIVGIITNILLFAAKITVGLLTSSVSVVADAVNNLSDAGSSAFVYVGYKLSG